MITPETTAILAIIPQRHPFVMVDALTYYDDRTVETSFVIRQSNLMLSCDNTMCAYGLLENIAQSCAARIGYKNLISGEPIKIGVIGAVKDFTVSRQPAVSETLRTEIDVVDEVFTMTLVEGRIYVEEELIASCQMKISLN